MTEIDEREGRLVRAIPVDSFGNRLMLVRAHLGHLTVKDAAERCGLNYGSWSNWEHGKLPRDILDVAEAVAEGLSIDRDWLLHGGPLAETARRQRREVRSPYSPSTSGPGRHLRRPRRLDRHERIPA